MGITAHRRMVELMCRREYRNKVVQGLVEFEGQFMIPVRNYHLHPVIDSSIGVWLVAQRSNRGHFEANTPLSGNMLTSAISQSFTDEPELAVTECPLALRALPLPVPRPSRSVLALC